jgi:hypothetical protein
LDLAGVWEGTLDGTNWGRLLIKLSEHNGVLAGQAEITDIGVGIFTLEVVGRRDAAAVSLHLTNSRYGIRSYPGTIDAKIDSATESLVRGRWQSSIGTHGTFRAERRSAPEPPVDVVAKRIEEANAAFIMMAFGDQSPGHLPIVDIQAAIKRGCDAVGVRAHRADEVEHSGSITSLILDHIKRHRFLISDLTHERPNVYYEIGFAHGMEKEVVLTAHTGTALHFDIASYNVIFYASVTELEDRVARRLRARIENAEQLNG